MKAKTLIIAIAVIVVSSAAGLTGGNFMRRINNNVEEVIKIKFKQWKTGNVIASGYMTDRLSRTHVIAVSVAVPGRSEP